MVLLWCTRLHLRLSLIYVSAVSALRVSEQVFAFGTATFIFLSAFVLFYSYYNRRFDKELIKNFYLNRLKFVIIPYIIFSGLYFYIVASPFTHYSDNAEIVWDFLVKLGTGKAYDHLYFVSISIQFYLLFLCCSGFLRKTKLLSNMVWFGFVLQWAFVFLNSYYFRITIGTGSIAFSYMSYYFLGAFLGIYYRQFMDWWSGWKTRLLVGLWLLFGGLYAWIYYAMWAQNIYYNAKWYTFFWNFYTYAAALVLFLFSFWLYKKLPVSLTNRLMQLGVYSFGIYIFHMIELRFYRKKISAIFHGFIMFPFWRFAVHCSFPGLWCGLRAEPVPFHGSYSEDFETIARL